MKLYMVSEAVHAFKLLVAAYHWTSERQVVGVGDEMVSEMGLSIE
jgi:hypothetical protein